MTRIVALLAVGWLALGTVAFAAAGPVLADDPAGQAPGARATAGRAIDYDLTTEPALPYIVALLVTSAGLAIVGFVTMRTQRRPTAGDRPTARHGGPRPTPQASETPAPRQPPETPGPR